MAQTKLALFDIDGTLTQYVGTQRWEDPYIEPLKDIFNVPIEEDLTQYDGTIARHLGWEIVKKYGVTRQQFEAKFPEYVAKMHKRFLEFERESDVLFKPIREARELLGRLANKKDVILGILTGNPERVAHWKLVHTGLDAYFRFGLYGDEADNRAQLASFVFEKAKRELGVTLTPNQVIVIGDTVHDIRSGKAIGAVTVGVTSGEHSPRGALSLEKPDYLVDSLVDPEILSLFSLR